MTQPNAFLVGPDGFPTKNGVFIAPDGSITFLTYNSSGQQVQSAGLSGAVIAIPRSAGQLSGTPSATDVSLGAVAQFYDPAQSIDSTHPWVYYTATTTAYVKISSGSGGGAVQTVNSISPDGSGNIILTPGNVLSVPQAGYGIDCSSIPSVPALTNGTPVTINGIPIFALTVTAGGSITIDGNTYITKVNDILQLTPNVGYTALTWVLNPFPPTSAAVVGTDSNGNLVKAAPGVNFAAATSYTNEVPRFVPSSGTVTNTTGVVTLTAPKNYPDGAWAFFPANALFSGQAQGTGYWVVGTGGTYQVYTATFIPGTSSPTIPTGLTPLTTVAGSYTQVLTAYILDQYTAPAATLGVSGKTRGQIQGLCNNSAGVKTTSIVVNGTNLGQFTNTTGQNFGGDYYIANLGRSDRQFGGLVSQTNQTSFPFNGSIATDTTPLTVRVTCQLGVATDTVGIITFDGTYSGASQA